MNHEQAEIRIPDFIHGRLRPQESLGLKTHLVQCPDCRSQLALYADVRRQFGTDTQWDSHATSDEIVSLALQPVTLDPDDLSRIVNHVRMCGPCQADAEAVRCADREMSISSSNELEQEEVAQTSRWRSVFSFRTGLLSAAAVLVLTVYPVYLGLVRMPQVQARLQALQHQNNSLANARGTPNSDSRGGTSSNRLTEGTGPFFLHLLRAPLRSDGSPITISLSNEESWLSIALENPLNFAELSGRSGRTVTIKVTNSRHQQVWSASIAIEEIKRIVAKSDGVLPIRLPASAFPSGSYVIAVGTGSLSTTAIPFVVIR